MDQFYLPLHDAGLVWGATVTDLCRTFRHKLFRWEEHLSRFEQSCRLARIPLAKTRAEITQAAHALVEREAKQLAADGDLALVLIATPGPIGYLAGLPGGPGDGEPTLRMHTFPLPFERYRRLVTEGARLVIPSIPHVPAACVPRQVKHRSRLAWWLAEQEARDVDPRANALLADVDGCITETAAANLLLVKDGAVFSPPDDRILPGVTLQAVKEICHRLAVSFRSGVLTLDDCLAADEAFLTCSTFCLAPVAAFNGKHVPVNGEIYRRMCQAWRELAGIDVHQQILGNR